MYSYSTDGEQYIGNFDSIDEAAKEAFSARPDIYHVWVGERLTCTAHDFIYPGDILYKICDAAYDEVNEFSNEWLGELLNNDTKLEEFKKLIGDWLQEQEPPLFFSVKNEQDIYRS